MALIQLLILRGVLISSVLCDPHSEQAWWDLCACSREARISCARGACTSGTMSLMPPSAWLQMGIMVTVFSSISQQRIDSASSLPMARCAVT